MFSIDNRKIDITLFNLIKYDNENHCNQLNKFFNLIIHLINTQPEYFLLILDFPIYYFFLKDSSDLIPWQYPPQKSLTNLILNDPVKHWTFNINNYTKEFINIVGNNYNVNGKCIFFGHYKYINNHYASPDRIRLRFEQFTTDIKPIHIQNNSFEVHLSSIAVLSRYILIFSILKIIFHYNLSNSISHPLSLLISKKLSNNKPKSLPECYFVTFQLKSQLKSIEIRMNYEIFLLKYQYFFSDKINDQSVSNKFFIKGVEYQIEIQDISHGKYNNYIYTDIFQYIIDITQKELLIIIHNILKNCLLDQNIDIITLWSCVLDELHYFFNRGIHDYTLNLE